MLSADSVMNGIGAEFFRRCGVGGPMTSADEAFRVAFGRCEISNHAFRHRDHLARRPHLLDRELPLKHYSPARLWDQSSRDRWTEPDLRAFPEVGAL